MAKQWVEWYAAFDKAVASSRRESETARAYRFLVRNGCDGRVVTWLSYNYTRHHAEPTAERVLGYTLPAGASRWRLETAKIEHSERYCRQLAAAAKKLAEVRAVIEQHAILAPHLPLATKEQLQVMEAVARNLRLPMEVVYTTPNDLLFALVEYVRHKTGRRRISKLLPLLERGYQAHGVRGGLSAEVIAKRVGRGYEHRDPDGAAALRAFIRGELPGEDFEAVILRQFTSAMERLAA